MLRLNTRRANIFLSLWKWIYDATTLYLLYLSQLHISAIDLAG